MIGKILKILALLIREKDYDLAHQLKSNATKEAIDFYQRNMAECIVFSNKKSMIDFELENIKISGSYLEFGVANAVHTNYIAKKISPKTIHGFDSFEGFPEYFDGIKKELHDFHGKLPWVEKNVILHQGWFDQTLPKFVKNNNEKIAYLNIDCDLYSSTKTVLSNLADKLQVGTIIHFDEFLNFPGWKNHEFKAWNEFLDNHKIKFEYLAVGNRGEITLIINSITNE